MKSSLAIVCRSVSGIKYMDVIHWGFYVPNMDDEDRKKLIKQALKEWLDEKFSEFGKWSLGAIAAAGLVALTYFILKMDGWHR